MTTDKAAAPVVDFVPCRCDCNDPMSVVVQRTDAPHQLRGELYLVCCKWCGFGMPFIAPGFYGDSVMPQAITLWNAAMQAAPVGAVPPQIAYRVVPLGDAFEPQMHYQSGMAGWVWFSLSSNGYWADPDAFSSGDVSKRSPMTREEADRAIVRAQAINGTHIASAVGAVPQGVVTVDSAAMDSRLAELQAALASQAARMGELEQDAARYAVLRDVGPPDASGYPTLLQWALVTQERGSGRLLFGSELDAAIDKLRGEAG